MSKVVVEIEERLNLCGFAYFRDGERSGRVLWSCEATGPGQQHKLTLDASWGIPSDEAIEAIRKAVIEFVRKPREGPFPGG